MVRIILSCLGNNQKKLERLKNNGIEIDGYVPKSKANKDGNAENRVRLLQRMVQRLQKRSSADRIYVSPICTSSDPLAARDMPMPIEIINSLKDIQGTMQGTKGNRITSKIVTHSPQKQRECAICMFRSSAEAIVVIGYEFVCRCPEDEPVDPWRGRQR
ncbi:hypothetical protein VTP01DRAFT_9452 [Rhizomucor pusillus]|uniref:uncharacterized protein n=1 Tax=Rhizomucor pusillus TaxID=4840 RepID=UPI0037431ADA